MITETRHAGTTDPVSIDCHAAPCEICCGTGRVVTEYNGDGEYLVVPAHGYESGQRDCVCVGSDR